MLTQEQIQHFAAKLTRNGTPVRFMVDGCSVKIAKTIGARAVFSS